MKRASMKMQMLKSATQALDDDDDLTMIKHYSTDL